MSKTIDAATLGRMVRAMREPCDECKAGNGDPCRDKSGPMQLAPGIPRELHKSRMRKALDRESAERKTAARAPLDQWLADNGARFVYTAKPLDNSEGSVECYRLGSALLLVQFYPRGGWDVFTALPGNDVATSFADALMRCSAPVAPASDKL